MIGRWKSAKTKVPRGAEGWRAYAIGDVHGRLDLLDGALQQIAADHAERGGGRRGLLIFLGDLIDRGPNSVGVIERVRSGPLPGFRTVALAGNHEEVLLRLVDAQELGLLDQWLGFGGDACLRSYGGDPDLLAAMPEEEALRQLGAVIPADHLAFLRDLGDTFSFGDYLFVHAGLRPGVPLSRQRQSDLRWIRRDFLDDPRDHGVMVVHGHTITEQIDEKPNRIGIDTGAYYFGVLTVVGVEDEHRWYLQQSEVPASEAHG
ncbi:MAG TPA: metallophosphoesterase family protein [Sphingomicrobium sp.]|nr:metallophosphoesterase family protein [Sphingomicrobium sp.]